MRFAPLPPDFGAAIKGLKTLASVRNAIDTALANGKIAANVLADDVRAKLALHKEYVIDQNGLFSPDLQQLIAKPMEDFQLTIRSRIEQYKQAEAQRKAEADKEAEQQAQRPLRLLPQLQAVSAPTPETLRAAVVEHQDEISAFCVAVNSAGRKQDSRRTG